MKFVVLWNVAPCSLDGVSEVRTSFIIRAMNNA
jgi:hypothetical protein